jgi:prepilin-type processing-associated H-X9-DG protein
MNDTQPGDFAVMADMNPGIRGHGDDVIIVHPDDPPIVRARGNSNNHQKAGQNVLYADGHVAFQLTPFCGLGKDNIYTALVPENKPPAHGPGAWGPGVGPTWFADSYLVPTDDEGPP